MKTIILTMLAAFVSLTSYAQYYTHKVTVHETADSTGLHYSAEQYSTQSGFISLQNKKLILYTNGYAKRVYTLNFEPVIHYRGLYFMATFEGRLYECWYNKQHSWLLVKRFGYMNYYHFKKEQ